MNKICTEYTNHQYDICKTVTELCELPDGVSHWGVVNKTDICSLLDFYVLIKIHAYNCLFYLFILILLLLLVIHLNFMCSTLYEVCANKDIYIYIY